LAKKIVTGIYNVITKIGKVIYENILAPIGRLISNICEGIYKFAEMMLTKIGQAFKAIGLAIYNAAKVMYDVLLKPVVDAINFICKRLYEAAKFVINKIGDALSNAYAAINKGIAAISLFINSRIIEPIRKALVSLCDAIYNTAKNVVIFAKKHALPILALVTVVPVVAYATYKAANATYKFLDLAINGTQKENVVAVEGKVQTSREKKPSFAPMFNAGLGAEGLKEKQKDNLASTMNFQFNHLTAKEKKSSIESKGASIKNTKPKDKNT